MNELLFFLEIVLTFGCVVAAKKIFGKAGLIAWIAIAMILANLTVVKTVNLFGIDATLGNIMFASTFLAGDMLNENYGRQAAHKGILVGLGGVLVFMVCTQISLLYTPSTTDVSHDAMALLFALNLRTSIASVAMCILANWLNVSLYAKIRELTHGKYLWLLNTFGFATMSQLSPVIALRTSYLFFWLLAVFIPPSRFSLLPVPPA